MAVYPIYKSRHAGANPEAAQETPVPQSEKYSWDWFQQPDAQPVEGQDDNGNELTFKLYSLSDTGIEQKAGA